MMLTEKLWSKLSLFFECVGSLVSCDSFFHPQKEKYLLFLRLSKKHQAKHRYNPSKGFFCLSTSKIFHAPQIRQEAQASNPYLSWCFLHNPINIVQSVVILSCNFLIIPYTKNQFLRFKFSKLTWAMAGFHSIFFYILATNPRQKVWSIF